MLSRSQKPANFTNVFEELRTIQCIKGRRPLDECNLDSPYPHEVGNGQRGIPRMLKNVSVGGLACNSAGEFFNLLGERRI